MGAARHMASGFLAAALVLGAASEAGARAHRRELQSRAPAPTQLGPWVREAWPGWGYAGDWAYDAGLVSAYPATDEWYPWGYVAPFVRVGGKCVANEFNRSPGGNYVRYQRVRPGYYCAP